MDNKDGSDDKGSKEEKASIDLVDKNPIAEKSGEAATVEEKPISDKILVLSLVIIIIALLALFISAKYFFPNKEVALTIEDAHKLNIEGKLSPELGYMYNGVHSFVLIDNMWYFQVQKGNVLVNVPLRYSPKDIEDIELKGVLDGRFLNANSIYITFDPLGSDITHVALAVAELDQSLISAFGNRIIAACDKNQTESGNMIPACENRPVVTCDSTDEAVIYIRESPVPQIALKGNCIDIEGYGMDLLKLTDRILLEFYGVMKRD